MSDALPVEGIFDVLKLDQLKGLIGLRKYLPLLTHLQKLPEFWAHIKAFELDKAGDILEAACVSLGFGDAGKVIDDILDAVESKDVSKILDELGDALKFVAALLKGKESNDVIRLPVVGDTHDTNKKTLMAELIDDYGLDVPKTVAAAGEPEPVENPMVIIGLIGVAIQALKLIWEWRRAKKQS